MLPACFRFAFGARRGATRPAASITARRSLALCANVYATPSAKRSTGYVKSLMFADFFGPVRDRSSRAWW
jgi:hypothetical protein